QRVQGGSLEICGGCYIENETGLLSVDSQLWNLEKGLALYEKLLGTKINIFARTRFGHHPHLPLLLNHVGLKRALLLAFNQALLPTYRSTMVNWPAPDGKQVEAFTRAPYQADSPQTFFHWAHYLHRTIAQDHTATLTLVHRGQAPATGYDELRMLN